MLLHVALLLADELGDLKIELVRNQHDESTPAPPPPTDPRLADRLASIAERIEGIAISLDKP
jgi:cell division protein ZapA